MHMGNVLTVTKPEERQARPASDFAQRAVTSFPPLPFSPSSLTDNQEAHASRPIGWQEEDGCL